MLAFGNVRSARVATLGLNPSRLEFLDSQGAELTGSQRRLETLRTLGVASLADADDATINRIVSGCDRYFERVPYRRWFDQLEMVLAGLDASYYGGTACHLDLVQWATDPVWGELPRSVCAEASERDWPFLREQLQQESIGTLLLNGRAVLDRSMLAMGASLKVVGQLEVGKARSELLVGWFGDVKAIGWSANLQSSFGISNEFRLRLRDWVHSTSTS